MKINEVAKLTGITVRTLHYYDEIGLLKPSEITATGYRIYDNQCLELLQQILFLRELDFSLNDIKDIIQNKNYNKNDALQKQKELLIKKRDRLNSLITLLNSTIKGENDMSFKQFDMTEIENTKKEYAKEVKERWGQTSAYAESEKKTANYDSEKWGMINEEGSSILKEFSAIRNEQCDSEKAQELIAKWQNYITKNFYKCTNKILSCLGMMYVGDQRFTENIDKNGKGTAEFMSKAIAYYCNKK